MDIQLTHPADKEASRRTDSSKERQSDPQSEPVSTTTTVVGPSIVIRGKLKCNEDLVIKGRVDAEITSTKAVHVENSGIVKANITVRSVKINGVLVGNITAESRTEIASDGRVVGDILTPKLVISDGATIRGRVDMPNFDAKNVVPEPIGIPAPPPPVESGMIASGEPVASKPLAPPIVASPPPPPPVPRSPFVAPPPPPLVASPPPLGVSPPPLVAPSPLPAESHATFDTTDSDPWDDSSAEQPPSGGMGAGLRRMLFDGKGKKRRP